MTTKTNTDKETKLKPERKIQSCLLHHLHHFPSEFLPSPDLTNHSQKTKTHFSPSHFLHTLFVENPNPNSVTRISSLSSQFQVLRTLVTVTTMTQLFRSKTCGLGGRSSSVFDSAPSSPSLYLPNEEEEEEEEEEMDDDDDDEYYAANPISTPLIVPESRERGRERQQNQQFQILAIMVAALRKSLMTCGVEKEDICSMDISPPTNVKHVSHVTFDRFNGFLGLPVEFQPKIPRRVPSASMRVFGVSAESMKCSYDDRGNSVPTILLMMQKRLYLEGGLQTEGIFRINAENSQEEYVRDQLNRGVVQHGIDVHCLAGLIKAWFRELPTGVLDSLTPDQVVNCNTEVDCMQLVRLLKPTEAALLDWAINLMADVVQHENHNKMNARNIAMVFAPNMTQMADPLTALIHAVQVMNFIQTLIIKTIRERDELSVKPRELSSCSVSPNNIDDPNSATMANGTSEEFIKQTCNYCVHDSPVSGIFLRSITKNRLESDAEESSWNFHKSGDDHKSISGNSTPINNTMGSTEEIRDGYSRDTGEGFLDRLSLRKGVRKLRKHPVFQLSKPVKKPADLGVLNTAGGGETWT